MVQPSNKKEISIEEQKEIQKGIFESVHNYCKKHGLRYFMTGGTLLGAVRHKGYIPWDDDIDIIMPRSDYQRFIELCEKEPISDNLSIASVYNNKDCIYPFIKVYRNDTVVIEHMSKVFKTGVWLDIFPLDNMSNNYDDAVKLFNEIKRLRIIKEAELWGSNNIVSWWKRIILVSYGKVLRTFYPLRHLLMKMEKKARRYESKNMSKYVCVVVMGIYGLSDIMVSSAYEDEVLLEFEGKLRCAPKDWDYVLKQLFKDYMTLPPVEKRITHHNYICYWK